ncbi:hypothetical protein NPS01_10480 [Nocardioides psychrotolerans]|nr:hypothetical protein NPS01_10480 [Nocardioides psychrotolerans]
MLTNVSASTEAGSADVSLQRGQLIAASQKLCDVTLSVGAAQVRADGPSQHGSAHPVPSWSFTAPPPLVARETSTGGAHGSGGSGFGVGHLAAGRGGLDPAPREHRLCGRHCAGSWAAAPSDGGSAGSTEGDPCSPCSTRASEAIASSPTAFSHRAAPVP